ncbi:MAG: YihY family inner membrane protein, partial [Gallionella sp.]
MRKNLQDILNLLRFVAARFNQDQCAQAAASLTFTTLLSLVPMITIALTMFSAFPVFDEFSVQIKSYLLSNMMPDKAGAIISTYMEQFAESASRLTAVGIAFLAVTAMSMMLTIDKTFNVIWRVTRPRPLLKRLVVYWAILTLAPLLVGASLSLTSWLIGLSMGYAKNIPFFGMGVLKILPTLFTTLAFYLLFRLVPNRYVPRAHAMIGALIAAVLFEAMNRGFGSYISHFPTYKLVYGAFASVPIFLMWIYLSWLIILFGAVIAASLSHWRMPDTQKQAPVVHLLNALRALQMMSQGLHEGRVTTFTDMSKKLRLGYDALEQLLDKLQSAQLVCKTEGQGWVMMRDAEHLRVTELLQLFALNRHALTAVKGDEKLKDWLTSCV